MKQEIKSVIIKIRDVLNNNDEGIYAGEFEYLNAQLESDYSEALYNIKRLYGGAGTFNNVVLHKNGWPLREENEDLTALRHKLYILTSEELDRQRR
ncbi:DUF6966 domain-containing protein [Serratia marcescens]|uniref:DUF6966 domain-containing protein n=1 Tax=Serratia marcescens TaxID=615 RepID=UPI000E2CCC28|nr:hypothetical protein [Serratia marcescens]